MSWSDDLLSYDIEPRCEREYGVWVDGGAGAETYAFGCGASTVSGGLAESGADVAVSCSTPKASCSEGKDCLGCCLVDSRSSIE